MKIIIYATHTFGTFEQLKEDKDVIVLGYGTKWDGFIKKAEFILEYLNTLNDGEIVAILDGFDSYIKKKTNLLETFNTFDCKVLVSLNDKSGISKYIPKYVDNYLMNKIFVSKDGYIANAGLMMGYVQYLKLVLHAIIKGPSSDDQRNLNIAMHELIYVKIDKQNIIFENCGSEKCVIDSNAYFCQTPGKLSFDRYYRGLFEYVPYFIEEILIILVIIIIIISIIRIIKSKYNEYRTNKLISHKN